MKAIKDSAIYLAGELISKSAPFLLLPYLSRKLGVEGFGELSYLQTFIALFAIFIGLSQDGAIARYFYAYGKRSLNLIVNSGYLYTFSLTSVLLIISCILKSEILAYLVLIAASQSILSVQLSLRQCQKRAISYTIIQLSSTFLSALLTIVMFETYSEDLVEKRMLTILISNISVSLVFYLFYQYGQRKRKLTLISFKKSLLYILAFGGPMILHHGSFFIKGQLDRIFIYHKFSEGDLGLYSMGSQISMILSVLILSINKAMVPYLFESLKERKVMLDDLYKWTIYSLLFIPIPSVISYLIPEELLLCILGDEFVGVKYYVTIFLLSTSLIVPYLLLVNYLFFYGETKLISICSLLSTGIYIIALIGFIFIDIRYVPYASVSGAIGILPILYFFTKKCQLRGSYEY